MTAAEQIIKKVPGLTIGKAEKVLNFIIKIENEPDNEGAERQERIKKVRNAGGRLHKYADTSRIPLEEGAFERAVIGMKCLQ